MKESTRRITNICNLMSCKSCRLVSLLNSGSPDGCATEMTYLKISFEWKDVQTFWCDMSTSKVIMSWGYQIHNS
jgi:hypothetical protein